MIIKSPPVYDVSHWKEIRDFSAIDPRPFLMITKATEGTTIVDSKFIRFMDGMKSIGCHRGAYHFFRKAQSAVAQAQYFSAFIKPFIDDNTLLILDMEEGGESAAAVMVWFDYVRSQFPRNRLLLYSAAYILNQMTMTETQKSYFRSVPIWTAGYPINPDQYSSVPGFYVPDQTRFGPVVMWQYSSHGAVAGIEGDVDLNWISPTYQALLGEAPGGATDPDTGVIMTKWYKVTASVLNIRNGPGASYADIGDLLQGDLIEATETIGGWHHITNVYKNGAIGNVTDPSWCSAAYTVECPAPVVEPQPDVKIPDYIVAHFPDGTERRYLPE